MAIRVVDFSNLERFLPKNQHTQGTILRIGLVGASEVFKNQSFRSQLFPSYEKKKLRKIRIIFDKENWLWKLGGLGDFALFDTSPLVQFSKFKNFLWVCWFLGKNLSNFVPPVWKLHNPYCHSGGMRPVGFGQIYLTFNSKVNGLNEVTVMVQIVVMNKLILLRDVP